MGNKVLIIGPSWVGDTVVAQSLFKYLKDKNRDYKIDVLAPSWTFSILSRMPEVARAIEMPISHGQIKLKERYKIGCSLRNQSYDHAIVLPNSFKSALIPWFAKIPRRTGWLGEKRYLLLNDIRRNKNQYSLLIDQYVALGADVNDVFDAKQFYPLLRTDQKAQFETLHKLKILPSKEPIIAISAGAEFGPSKRWPVTYYADVANQKLKEGWKVWLFGSMNDKKITHEIMALTKFQCIDFAGGLTLSETIDLLSLSTGLLTNDSGLMHVAAALNKSVIAIYGSTSPKFTPPLTEKANIIMKNIDCQPCFQRDCPLKHHRCMREITVDDVLAAIKKWKY